MLWSRFNHSNLVSFMLWIWRRKGKIINVWFRCNFPSDTIQYIYQQSEEIKWIDFLTGRGFKMLSLNLTVIYIIDYLFNPLSANPTKWPNTLKQFVGKLPTNCLSVSDHLVKLALKGLTLESITLNLKRKQFNFICFILLSIF